ncbi:MAG TPA: general secretion pathway protein GspB, partial [Steroidobacteraceae bacterium]|nr:general secretion pathway protein GspB [Steroidobacteraceae bacterium]
LVVGALLIVSVAVLAWLAWHGAPAPATAAAPVAPATAGVAGNAPAGAPPAAVAQPPVGTVPGTPGSAPAAPYAAPPAPPQAPSQTPAAATDNNPADTEPAVTPPAGSTREASSSANLHTYAELGGSLPELRLDLHVYAPNPAERYAFINMHKVREGDTTVEGVQVKEITREGVVLDYRGTEFLLGRQ